MSGEQDNKMIIGKDEYKHLITEINQLKARNKVDGGDQFWLFLWAIIGTALLGLATILSAYSYSQDKLFNESIEKSPENALQIACARDAMTSQTSPACMIYLTKLK